MMRSIDGSSSVDWSRTPAAAFAAALLAIASLAGLGWTLIHTQSRSSEILNTRGTQASASEIVPTAPALLHRVDLNIASAGELQILPGIGPVLAGEIKEDRAINGPFASIEDLARVHGIGPKTIESLRDRVIVAPIPAQASAGG